MKRSTAAFGVAVAVGLVAAGCGIVDGKDKAADAPADVVITRTVTESVPAARPTATVTKTVKRPEKIRVTVTGQPSSQGTRIAPTSATGSAGATPTPSAPSESVANSNYKSDIGTRRILADGSTKKLEVTVSKVRRSNRAIVSDGDEPKHTYVSFFIKINALNGVKEMWGKSWNVDPANWSVFAYGDGLNDYPLEFVNIRKPEFHKTELKPGESYNGWLTFDAPAHGKVQIEWAYGVEEWRY